MPPETQCLRKLSASGLSVHEMAANAYGRSAGQFTAVNLYQQLQSIAPGNGFRELVTADEARRFAAGFESSNHRLSTESGLHYPLFDDQFDEYSSQSTAKFADVPTILLELLGRESVARDRTAQIATQLRGENGLGRSQSVRIVCPDAEIVLSDGDFTESVVLDDSWTPHDSTWRAALFGDAVARGWFVVDNRAMPRLLNVVFEAEHNVSVCLELSTRGGTTAGSGAAGSVTGPSGISIVRFALRPDEGGDEPTEIGLTGICLSWG